MPSYFPFELPFCQQQTERTNFTSVMCRCPVVVIGFRPGVYFRRFGICIMLGGRSGKSIGQAVSPEQYLCIVQGCRCGGCLQPLHQHESSSQTGLHIVNPSLRSKRFILLPRSICFPKTMQAHPSQSQGQGRAKLSQCLLHRDYYTVLWEPLQVQVVALGLRLRDRQA